MRIMNEKIKCACCGKESEHEILLSFTMMGTPDLDYKATGMGSRAFLYAVQMCPECNYVSTDIGEKTPMYIEAQSKEYYKNAVAECEKLGLDENTKKFYLMGLVNEANGNQEEASNNYLCAYWLTERTDEKTANKFLKRTLALRSKNYNKLTKRFALQTLDLLRRVGQFNEVINECEELLKLGKIGEEQFTENEIKQMKYEIKICKLGDTTRHNYFDVAMDDTI